MPHTYLTKSKFKTALECPRKLLYAQQPHLYPNAQLSDAFLQQLAEGGFQVGELAKDYYPGGIEVPRGKHAVAAAQTLALLQQTNVIIYEAAFLWQNCYVLADVVVKTGNQLHLIEVKAKGYNPNEDRFWGKKDVDKLAKNWESYLYDVAFQTYVVSQSLQANNLSSIQIAPFLLLANKAAVATVNGMNQLYQLVSIDSEGRKKVQKTTNATLYNKESLGNEILIKVPVSKEVTHIIEVGKVGDLDFKQAVALYSEALLDCTANEPIFKGRIVKGTCKTCEFSIKNTDSGLSGKETCLQQYAQFTAQDFDKPMVWDIWNFKKADALIQEHRYFMHQVDRADLEPKNPSKKVIIGMSGVDRQELQVQKCRNKEVTPEVLTTELYNEIQQWQFPLHFIDFEGTRTALPFYKNMKPYEQVAFQFSHHIMHKDGCIEHATEWLNMESGYFPNFDFVRALKLALSNDDGTVFKYATYENTVLNTIETQLLDSNETDKAELIEFIHTLTYKKGTREPGYRNMIDLCDVIKKYYYNPLTNGSNSIKYVLPAILNTSKQLQEKYNQPIYGNIIRSKNFTNQVWIQKEETGKVKDPYKLLKNIYDGLIEINPDEEYTNDDDASVANGGAAMAAYNEIQFSATSNERKADLKKQLLRYCELDTLAMVMVYEELVHVCK